MERYVLLAQRQDGSDSPICIYVTADKAKADAHAQRCESRRVHYWVVPYAEAFPWPFPKDNRQSLRFWLSGS